MGVEAIGRTFALMPSESASFLLSRFLFFPDIALYRLAAHAGAPTASQRNLDRGCC